MVVYICELASVTELSLQEFVVAVELSFNRKIGLDSGHFAHRLHIDAVEGAPVTLHCHVLKYVPVIVESWCWNDGDVSFIAL